MISFPEYILEYLGPSLATWLNLEYYCIVICTDNRKTHGSSDIGKLMIVIDKS
jgi:hypothetical protein